MQNKNETHHLDTVIAMYGMNQFEQAYVLAFNMMVHQPISTQTDPWKEFLEHAEEQEVEELDLKNERFNLDMIILALAENPKNKDFVIDEAGGDWMYIDSFTNTHPKFTLELLLIYQAMVVKGFMWSKDRTDIKYDRYEGI